MAHQRLPIAIPTRQQQQPLLTLEDLIDPRFLMSNGDSQSMPSSFESTPRFSLADEVHYQHHQQQHQIQRHHHQQQQEMYDAQMLSSPQCPVSYMMMSPSSPANPTPSPYADGFPPHHPFLMLPPTYYLTDPATHNHHHQPQPYPNNMLKHPSSHQHQQHHDPHARPCSVDPEDITALTTGRNHLNLNHTPTPGQNHPHHLPTKSKPKTIPCSFPGCPKVFSRQYNMRAHMEIHEPVRTKEHSCPECGRAFSRRHDMYRHQRNIHHPVRPNANLYQS